MKTLYLLLASCAVAASEEDACGCSSSRDYTAPQPADTCAESCPATSATSSSIEIHLLPIPAQTAILGYAAPTSICSTCDWAGFVPHPADSETPIRTVILSSYYIDKYPVSVADFTLFQTATNHLPTAAHYNDSFVFTPLASQTNPCLDLQSRHAAVNWWALASGVSWDRPFGPPCQEGEDPVEGMLDHPVTHVSYFDARAFCKWRGYADAGVALDKSGRKWVTRLPTEDEWEVASRGGKEGRVYPWGNKEVGGKGFRGNYYQGDFPDGNSGEDGFVGTNPRGAFPAQNDYGVEDMVGNVWEWTDTKWRDEGEFDSSDAYERLSEEERIELQVEPPDYVKKGGSYLCHKSYCYRYRNAARSMNTIDTTAGNLGFRCVRAPSNV